MNPRRLALALSCLLRRDRSSSRCWPWPARPGVRRPGRRTTAPRAGRVRRGRGAGGAARVGRAPGSGLGGRRRRRPAPALPAGSRPGRHDRAMLRGVRRARAAGAPACGCRCSPSTSRSRSPRPAGAARHRPAGRWRRRRRTASARALPTRPAVDPAGRRWSGSRGSGGWRRFRPVRPRGPRPTSRSGTRSPSSSSAAGRMFSEPSSSGAIGAGGRPCRIGRRRDQRAPCGARARASASVNSAFVGVSGQQRLNGPAAVVVLGQERRRRRASRAARPSGSTGGRRRAARPSPALNSEPQLLERWRWSGP